MVERVVIDTSVIVAACMSAGGGSRAVLNLCLRKKCQPIVGAALFAEYEDVFARIDAFKNSPLSRIEREELLDAFLSVCEWTRIYFLWRPNLPDEGDNHLIELAVAGAATSLVTHNVKHLSRGELHFPQIRIETPKIFLDKWRGDHGNDDH